MMAETQSSVFAFPPDFFPANLPIETESQAPSYIDAFRWCPAAHLQEIPQHLRPTWQAATRTVASALAITEPGPEVLPIHMNSTRHLRQFAKERSRPFYVLLEQD